MSGSIASSIERERLTQNDSATHQWDLAQQGVADSAEGEQESAFWTQVILCILLMRSALDLYSGKGVPAAFAIAVDLFVLAFVARQFILRRPVKIDRFWWLLMGWVALQGIWVALLPTGALGGTAFMAYEAMREWVRFFSLGLVYLLAMQLRDRIPPARLVSILMLSLVIPLFLAALQIARVDLPGFLQSDVGWKDFTGTGDRINSTLGHYNSFATFTLLFISLTLWRLQMSRRPFGWAILLAGLLYCLVATKSLTGLVMLIVFGALYFLPRLRGKGLFGALALVVTLWLLLSTELGQERLLELNKTPLLNPDLTFHEAAVLQAADMKEFRNSFNWRLLQWRGLLENWRLHPWLGYGLASTKELSNFNTTSHNDYMRFLLEGGVVGLGLFLTFLVAQVTRTLQIMRRSLPGSPQRSLAQTMFPFSIALMVGMAAGNVMVHTATFFYWWVLLAILGWDWPRQFSAAAVPVGTPLARKRARRLAVESYNAVEGYDAVEGYNAVESYGAVESRGSEAAESNVLPSDSSQTELAQADNIQRGAVAIASDDRNFDLDIEGTDIERSDRYSLQAYDADNSLNPYFDAYDEDIYRSDRYELDSDIEQSR